MPEIQADTVYRRLGMKIDSKRIMEKAAGASTGLTVVIAFLNVALLVAKIVQTVSETDTLTKTEEND